MPKLPKRCSESNSEDIESDNASTATTTTTEDIENNDTDVPSDRHLSAYVATASIKTKDPTAS